MLGKHFPSPYPVTYRLCLNSLGLRKRVSIKAFKIFTQKSSQDNIANDDYKKATILPIKHRLMHNKARFMHKILSGKAPTYLVKECLSTFIPGITQESLMYPCLD